MKNFLIYSLVFLLTSFESAAQEIFSNIIPPPSGSAGLGAMTNISTNNYSGTANINIPLINIIEKEYPLDISLSYNTTGRKVAEVPSWVGLGWNLNAGGLITRTVMSMPDDYNEDGNRKWKSLSGIEFPIRKGKGYQYVGSSIIDNTLIGTGNDDSKIANIKNKIYGDGMDTEPDIFYFNFNGHSGKFVMNQDKKIYLLPGYNSDLSIQYINSNGIYFLLTDSDQTKYYFNTTEISHITNQAFVNETISCIEYTSSWYLSQIVTKSGTSIDFTYDKSMIDVSDITPSYFGTSLFTSQSHYYTNIYQELLFIESIKSSNTLVKFIKGYREDRFSVAPYPNAKLFSIEVISGFDNILQRRIQFNYDYTSASIDKRLCLKEINEGILGKPSYQFQYSSIKLPEGGTYKEPRRPIVPCYEQDIWGYYNANKATTLIPNIYVYPELVKQNRFRISPITNYSGRFFELKGGADRRPNPTVTEAGMLKKIKLPTGGSISFIYESNNYFDDIANENTLGAGVRIKQKIVSDGVNVANDLYENYDYTQSDNSTRSSGKLLSIPVFAFPVGHYNIPNKVPASGLVLKECASNTKLIDYTAYKTSTKNNTEDLYNIFTLRYSTPQSEMSDISVGYSEVTIKKPGFGKTKYTYSIPLPYGTASESNITSTNLTLPVSNFSQNISSPLIASNVNYDKDALNDGFIFGGPYSNPFPPSINVDAWRGLLLSKIDYDMSDRKVKESTFAYNSILNSSVNPFIINGYKTFSTQEATSFGSNVIFSNNLRYENHEICNYKQYEGSLYWAKLCNTSAGTADIACASYYDDNGKTFWVCNIPRCYPYEISGTRKQGYFAYSYYSLYLKYKVKLASQTERIYDLNDIANLKYMENVLNLSYSGKGHHNVSEKITWNSKNEKIINQYKYPSDYEPFHSYLSNAPLNENEQENSGLGKIYYRGDRSQVIENTTILEKSTTEKFVIASSLLTFRRNKLSEFSGIPNYSLPYQIYNAEIANPIRESVFLPYNPSKFVKDPTHKILKTFSHDKNNNLIDIAITNDVNSSILWGYNNTLPVAEIINAKSEEIAYTGFEEPINWNVDWLERDYILGSANDCSTCPLIYEKSTDAHTGKYSFVFQDDLKYSIANTDNKSEFIISFWIKSKIATNVYFGGIKIPIPFTADKWVPFEIEYKGILKTFTMDSDSYNSNTLIDDIRIFPKGAIMTTYTYNPLTGKTSSLDVNNRTAISVLDNEGKTILTRDLENDIKTRTVYDYSLANKNNPFINFEYLTKDNAVNNKYYIKVNSNMLENGNKIFIDYGDGTNVNVTNLDEVIHLYPITKNKNYPVSMVVKDKDNKSISNTIIENIYIK